MAAIKIPSVNQLIVIAITLVVLMFVVRMLPDNVRALFRA